jgi:hypothetical protein
MKSCSRCGHPKSIAEMAKQKGSPDGLSSWCLACYREVNLIPNREYQRSKQTLVGSLKAGPCVDCLRTFPSCCMDFDHVRGEKTKSVARIVSSSSPNRILEEVAKCELVCACCHRVRTSARKEAPKNPRWLRFYERLIPFKSRPCLDCGVPFPTCCMDFDHVRGDKTIILAKMFTFPWAKVLEEIDKCDLVCACCHRIRTQNRLAGRVAA